MALKKRNGQEIPSEAADGGVKVTGILLILWFKVKDPSDILCENVGLIPTLSKQTHPPGFRRGTADTTCFL